MKSQLKWQAAVVFVGSGRSAHRAPVLRRLPGHAPDRPHRGALRLRHRPGLQPGRHLGSVQPRRPGSRGRRRTGSIPTTSTSSGGPHSPRTARAASTPWRASTSSATTTPAILARERHRLDGHVRPSHRSEDDDRHRRRRRGRRLGQQPRAGGHQRVGSTSLRGQHRRHPERGDRADRLRLQLRTDPLVYGSYSTPRAWSAPATSRAAPTPARATAVDPSSHPSRAAGTASSASAGALDARSRSHPGLTRMAGNTLRSAGPRGSRPETTFGLDHDDIVGSGGQPKSAPPPSRLRHPAKVARRGTGHRDPERSPFAKCRKLKASRRSDAATGR